MDTDINKRSNLFSFMVVRDPAAIAEKTLRTAYIQDDAITYSGRKAIDIFAQNSGSDIGRLVYEKVFCPPPDPVDTNERPTSETVPKPSLKMRNVEIVEASVGLLVPNYAPCPGRDPPEGIEPVSIELLVGRHYFERGDLIYILPDRLRDINNPWMEKLSHVISICRVARTASEITALPAKVAALFDKQNLYEVVFYKGQSHHDFLAAKRALFDNLYLLYILRRAFELSLEDSIEGLRTLHVLEGLAIDEYLSKVRANRGPLPNDSGLLSTLKVLYPVLQDWNFRTNLAGLPLISNRAKLEKHLEAVVVVHPIFARLHNFRVPFNSIRPIGIGDLKVVKQTALEYLASDISHIDNVLKGETKLRTHRRLEKSEDTYSFMSEEQSETQRDTQSTDRFELKQEAEATINRVLNVNANASVTYNGMPVVATVSGGVAYTQTSNEAEKIAQNFAREVVDKAVRRVQSRVSQQRTSTRLLEVEETNTHTFENKTGTGHVSGIYRWLERRYRAQTFNFGKRLMFEFVLPEPAAFFAEARLRAYEATLDVPQSPTMPVATPLPAEVNALRPEHINPQKFKDLQRIYDLSEFTYPQLTKHVELVNQASAKNYFSEADIDATWTRWQSRSFEVKLDAKGFRLDKILINGRLFFWGQDGSLSDDTANNPGDINTFILRVNGYESTPPVSVDNSREYWHINNAALAFQNMPALTDDTATLFLGFWDISRYDLSFHAELTLDADVLYAWQADVYHKIIAIERARADAKDELNQQTYAADFSRYKSRLSEIRAEAISELLRGQSSSSNRQVILDELKKHCISMIAKEFDTDITDDSFSGIEAIGARSVSTILRPFRIRETGTETTAGFEQKNITVQFPSIDIAAAKTKGRYIQFLEQAFEWQQLAWMFYPYFWASSQRWVETMTRHDDADPQFTAFLQAGSARVLVAVTPAYETAVMHFIATGEPWDGGPAPAIGDPLFLPIHEELRRQKDDLYGGKADGDPWEFMVPTSLIYLEGSSTPLPELPPES